MNENVTSNPPELSVVVAVVSDSRHLEGCLVALSQQENAPAMEIIVPYDTDDKDIQSLESRFPHVRFHRVDNLHSVNNRQRASREHHDKLRAIGLGLARGEVVALLEDHGRADKHWAMHVMEESKQQPHAVIGGAIENEVDLLLNWAIYFCDFGRYQNPLKAGPSSYVSDANLLYKREALDNIRELWQDAFHETSVNAALMAQGEILWLSPKIVVYQHRENLSLARALQERYVWGRSYAGTHAQEIKFIKRFLHLAMSPILPLLLVARKTRDVLSRRRLIGTFIRTLPFTLLLTVFWSVGEFMGYLTAKPNRFWEKGQEA